MKELMNFEITQFQLAKWQDYIEEELGFILPVRQQHWLKQGVINVANNVSTTPMQLLEQVKTDTKLRQEVFDAVLIPESRFFRHEESLNFIAAQAKQFRLQHSLSAPAVSLQTSLQNTGKPASTDSLKQNEVDLNTPVYRVWSVGCSFGQETWSMAMVLDKLSIPFEIWGTDVSVRVLEHAKRATYALRELENIPKAYHRYTDVQKNKWQVASKLHPSVHFTYHNLFTSEKAIPCLVNAIICQNVLIYFRQFDQRDILSRLVDQLADGGYLVLAPGEAVNWQHPLMHKVNNRSVNAWRKLG